MAFGPYLKDAGFSHAQPLLPTSISTSSGDDAHPFLHWKGTGLISLLVFTPESALLLWGLCEVRCGSEPCFPVGFPHFHAKKRQQMWWSNNSVCSSNSTAENVASLSSLYYSALDPDLILDGYLFAAAIQSWSCGILVQIDVLLQPVGCEAPHLSPWSTHSHVSS